MLHIYCGNGKGKTSAAVGLAVRAAGAGLRVAFFQFLKDGSSSELNVLRSIDNIEVFCCEECRTFVSALSESEIESVIQHHNRNINSAIDLIASGNVDLIVLDELCAAFNKKLLDTEKALELISLKDRCEIAVTGRDPDERFLNFADYISEIKAVRHPYDKGISARQGIEY